jgi:hypothetical protein
VGGFSLLDYGLAVVELDQRAFSPDEVLWRKIR